MNLAISVLVVLPLTIVLLRRTIPEPFAFAAGAFMMFVTGYPFNRELARAAGRELKLITHFGLSLLGAIVGGAIGWLLL